MKLFTPVFALIGAALIAALCFACTTPERQAAAQALSEAITASTRDGVVTQTEVDEITALTKAFTDAPADGTDWTSLLGTALGSIGATFFGLRYAPNSVIVGKQEAAALDKLAGTG
jgi:Flp pilus assembly protein TadD